MPGSGINTSIYAPDESIKRSDDNLSFLFIARLIKDKGIEEYIEAIKQLKPLHPKVSFKILGSLYPGNPTSIQEKELNSWIEEDLVQYLGHSDDVKSEILKIDCVVLPSYREGLSRVLLEAASLTKPIITTDTPGCRDVVDDGVNGFLCAVKDSTDLALQIQKMISLTTEERATMGQKGREKIINEFEENLVIEKYINTNRYYYRPN